LVKPTCAHRIGATAIEPGFLHWAGRKHSSWWQRYTDLEIGTTACFFCAKHARLYKTAVIILECAWYGAQFGRTRLPNWMAPTSHLGLQATIYSKLAAVPNLVRTELWRLRPQYYTTIGLLAGSGLPYFVRTVLRPWVVVHGPPT